MSHHLHHYTLTDLVDLALGDEGSERGVVNFNLLHAVLRTVLKELGIERSRPGSDRTAQTTSQQVDAGKQRSRPKKGSKEDVAPPLDGEAPAPETATAPEEEEEKVPMRERKVDAEWENIVSDIKGPTIEKPQQQQQVVAGGRVGDAWKYTQLRTKVDSNEENIMRLNEIVHNLMQKVSKGGFKKKGQGGRASQDLEGAAQRGGAGGVGGAHGGPGGGGGAQGGGAQGGGGAGAQGGGGAGAQGGGAEALGADGLEQGSAGRKGGAFDDEDDDEVGWGSDDDVFQTGRGGVAGADVPSMADFESLEDRVVSLEEAREIFENDHERLEVALKVQEKMVKEVTKFKETVGKIDQMEKDIATKADHQEMIEELAKKGDLELVNSKVDQLEFETAIEELGESIGRLGLKFQKKVDEWEDKRAELWAGIDGKMSRDVFDQAMVTVDARMTAMSHALAQIKKLVDEVLNPDAGGVVRCMSCKRPAKESGRETLDEVATKRPLRLTKNSSSDSTDMNNASKLLRKSSTKRQRVEGPPYPDKKDVAFGLPNSALSGMGPIGDTKGDASSVPKLPDIHAKPSQQGEEKKKKSNTIPVAVPKKLPMKPQNKPPFFTRMKLEQLEREAEQKKIELCSEDDASAAADTSFDSTSDTSRSNYQKTSAISISNDAAKSLKVFVPTKYIKDPLRRAGV